MKLENSVSQFDFFPLEQKPILVLGDGLLLVLDQRYLWERFTSGLYWFVHDHEKITRGSEKDRSRWTQGYGEMVELMVEDQLRPLAPVLLGGARERSFYTEEDLERAYGDGVGRPDATVDLKHHVLMFEVQSGRLSKGTRFDGDSEWFRKDTERLIIKKCRQLASGGRAVLADPEALTGDPPYPGMKVLPFVVVGGGYPGEAVSGGYVEELLAQESLFVEAGFGKLGILSPAELEMLEGLSESGEDIAALLVEWKASALKNVSLWNFLADKFSDREHLRPARMEPRIEATFEELQSRLRPGEKEP